MDQFLAGHKRIELLSFARQANMLTTTPMSHDMERMEGIEPTTDGLENHCSIH